VNGKPGKIQAFRAGFAAIALVFAACAVGGWRAHAPNSLLLLLTFAGVVNCCAGYCALWHAAALERHAETSTAEAERVRRELRQLSARLIETEEEAKRRLSRELHDEIGQALALLQIEISQARKMLPARPAAASDCLQRAEKTAERAVETIRNISVLLRPALLDDLGLVPALRSQLDDFLRRSGMEGQFSAEGVAAELPETVETCVFRTVQEALHNCEKHSGAGKVRVSVRQLSGSLVAEIEDDGRGFALDRQRTPAGTGLGLLGMRERVAAAGGTLAIDSTPGRGARIAIHIPLPPKVSSGAPRNPVAV